jgi:hypothetical protein
MQYIACLVDLVRGWQLAYPDIWNPLQRTLLCRRRITSYSSRRCLCRRVQSKCCGRSRVHIQGRSADVWSRRRNLRGAANSDNRRLGTASIANYSIHVGREPTFKNERIYLFQSFPGFGQHDRSGNGHNHRVVAERRGNGHLQHPSGGTDTFADSGNLRRASNCGSVKHNCGCGDSVHLERKRAFFQHWNFVHCAVRGRDNIDRPINRLPRRDDR